MSKPSTPSKLKNEAKALNLQQLSEIIQKQAIEIERLQKDRNILFDMIDELQDENYIMQKSILSAENNIKTAREGISATLELMFGMFKKLFAKAYGQDESTVSIIKEMKLSSVRCTTCLKSFEIRSNSNYTGSKFTCPDCPRPLSRKFKLGSISAQPKSIHPDDDSQSDYF